MRLLGLLVVIVSAAKVPIAAAQPVEVGGSVGVAVPSPTVGEFRRPGRHLALTAGLGTRSAGFGARIDLAVERLAADEPTPATWSSGYGDVDARSIRASLVRTFGTGRARPYLLAGGGIYHLNNPEAPNAFGNVGGAHVGVGVRLGSRRAIVLETQGVATASDHYRWVRYVPIGVGIRY